MATVSIITPVYNASAYLGPMIESVLNQIYVHWELILVDDCSSDSSIEIADDYARVDKRIKIHKLIRRSGPAVARNIAISKACGDYIAFLDADDLWDIEKLLVQINFMKSNGIHLSYTNYRVIDVRGNIKSKPKLPAKVSYRDLLKTNYMACLTVIYDARYLGKMEMPLIDKRQDLGLWLKILKKIDAAYLCDSCLGSYRITPGSLSSNKVLASLYTWRLYSSEKIPFFRRLYYFSIYAFRGITGLWKSEK